MRWTNVDNIKNGDQVEDPNGSTITVSGTESATLKYKGREVPAVTVSGKRRGSQENYSRTAQSGELWKKI